MRTRVLQLIHISDLHFQKGAPDKAAIALAGRAMDRKARDIVEKHNLGDWHEGTLGHDQVAVSAFRKFLTECKRDEPEWFGDPSNNSSPQTWLIDTGDASTFGDVRSLAEAQKRLLEWKAELKPCQFRSLYGNHDAWPGTQPAFLASGYEAHIEQQWNDIRQWNEWCVENWKPLRVSAPGGITFIECRAVNTVSLGLMDNVLAVGRISGDDVKDLCAQLTAAPAGGLHILAMHHPIAFPYETKERRVFGKEKMVLADAAELIQKLRNDEGAPNGTGRAPLAHLFLSGHTHLAHPGTKLPPNLQTLYQGELSTRQAQFVTGSLLLPRDFKKVRANAQPQVSTQANDKFALPQIYDGTQQFEVLRFFHDDQLDDGFLLERYVFARAPNGGDYRAVPELTNTIEGGDPVFIGW